MKEKFLKINEEDLQIDRTFQKCSFEQLNVLFGCRENLKILKLSEQVNE
jgi:hypothetical protein